MIQDGKIAFDNGNNILTIAFDLSKTFHSLPHGLLIPKTFAHGVELPLVNCRVAIYIIAANETWDAKSDWLSIEKGVP